MAAIHADKSLYPGINIHLNSFLQNEPGGWTNFHSEHVIQLRVAFDAHLPTGYFARSETSLQIEAFDAGTGEEQRSRTRPDVMVYRGPGVTGSPVAVMEVTTPTATHILPETLPEEEALTGLVIYQAGEGSVLGKPITRVELLSPANKPGGAHYEQYMVKRLQTLKSGLRLVEIDYLHQSPPVIPVLPDYSRHTPNAAPYLILVSDPRPTFDQGTTAVYAFDVDMPLPVINVPLAGADIVQVNFGAVYHRTFESARFFRLVVDYAQEPVNFASYSPDDQERIRQRLAEIRAKAVGNTPHE